MENHFKYEDARYFRDILKCLRQFTNETEFTMTPEGLKFEQMTANHIVLLSLNLPKHGFEEYYCSENTKITFDLDYTLKRVFKNVDKDDALTLNILNENKTEIFLASNLKRQFTIPLLENEDEEIPIPKITFTNKTKLILKDIQKILKDIPEYSSVTIEADRESITFKDNDYTDDAINYKVKINKYDGSLLDIETYEESKASYNKEYLEDFVKSVNKLSEIATLEFATDMPLKLTVPLRYGELVFYQAPRIEED